MAVPFAPSFTWAVLLFRCREALAESQISRAMYSGLSGQGLQVS
jgi:hypothetical protein